MWLTNNTVRPALRHLVDPLKRLLPKGEVSDAEHLVDQQNLRFEEGGDSECQSNLHAARVPLNRDVDEFRDA